MKETAYTFAVARIRVIENRLLSNSDLEQLINAPDYESALKLLREKGLTGENEDAQLSLKKQLAETWKMLYDMSPDKTGLEILIVKNDFHNLKAALKAFVTQDTESNYYITPSVVSHETIKSAIFNKRFSDLPPFLQVPAEKTYDALIRSMDGQLADIMIDAMTLEEISKRAEASGNDYIKKYAELLCVNANIKTAYRAAKTGKDEQFLKTALCDTKAINKTALVQAARKGTDDLISLLSEGTYKEAADTIRISLSAFEKWCDDAVMAHLESARYKSFGIEPLIGYYIARETEIQTARIILSCKRNGLGSAAIRERVRRLYV